MIHTYKKMESRPSQRVFLAISIAMLTKVASGMDICHNFDCDKNCDPDLYRDLFQPQNCDKCLCLDRESAETTDDSYSVQFRLGALESSVSQLKAMTGVLLGVVLLLLFIVFVLFMNRANNSPLKSKFLKYFCNKENIVTTEKSKKNCSNITGNATTISRLAEHQSNSSPNVRRVSMSRSALENSDQEPQPRPFRVRQPSESTCPEEGNDIIPQGYDNLALSTSTIDTSTLHNTSTSSASTLGPTLSTNTLDTTLPSENHIVSNGHISARV